MEDMTDPQACQVTSVQSWCCVTPLAACQKVIVLIGERQSCNKALRGDPPTQMKALRFVLCQGLVGNRRIQWPAGHKGRTTVLWLVCGVEGDINIYRLKCTLSALVSETQIWIFLLLLCQNLFIYIFSHLLCILCKFLGKIYLQMYMHK